VATTNRFEGKIISQGEINATRTYGIVPGKLTNLKVEGRLSKTGADADWDFAESYATAGLVMYKTTAETVIHKMVLALSLGTFASDAATDLTLWLGGQAALTNGITWGVGTVGTGIVVPDLYASTAAKCIADFASVWGAEVIRSFDAHDASSANDNHDSVIVTLDFVRMYGFPIRVAKGQFIGLHLNENFTSGQAAGLTTFTGKVFGRLIFS
jgi:hypothetical protein